MGSARRPHTRHPASASKQDADLGSGELRRDSEFGECGATKSSEINDGYFVFEVPAGDGPKSADQVISVDATAAEGALVATQTRGQFALPAHP
jgi:hypothetical protein